MVDLGIIFSSSNEFRELHNQFSNEEINEINYNESQVHQDEETGVSYYPFTWRQTITYECIATFVGDEEPAKTTLATERLIKRYQPEVIIMVGTAECINEDISLGDVIVVQTANNYLSGVKVVESDNQTFNFQPSGDPYRCSDNLVRAVEGLEFSKFYSEWHSAIIEKRQQIPLLTELEKNPFLQQTPKYKKGAIASGQIEACAEPFINWLKQNNRNYLAIEKASAGLLTAISSCGFPGKTLILKGISHFGDSRREQLEEKYNECLHSYAINNVITFLWKLLAAEILPSRSRNQSEKDNIRAGLIQGRQTRETQSSKRILDKQSVIQYDLRKLMDNLYHNITRQKICVFAIAGGCDSEVSINYFIERINEEFQAATGKSLSKIISITIFPQDGEEFPNQTIEQKISKEYNSNNLSLFFEDCKKHNLVLRISIPYPNSSLNTIITTNLTSLANDFPSDCHLVIIVHNYDLNIDNQANSIILKVQESFDNQLQDLQEYFNNVLSECQIDRGTIDTFIKNISNCYGYIWQTYKVLDDIIKQLYGNVYE